MATVQAEALYEVTPGEVIHRVLVVDGIRFTAEACNLDQAELLPAREGDTARRCARCNRESPAAESEFDKTEELPG